MKEGVALRAVRTPVRQYPHKYGRPREPLAVGYTWKEPSGVHPEHALKPNGSCRPLYTELTPLQSAGAQEAEIVADLRLSRASWSRDHLRNLASDWASWDAFADYHGLDPDAPTDTDLVAFV